MAMSLTMMSAPSARSRSSALRAEPAAVTCAPLVIKRFGQQVQRIRVVVDDQDPHTVFEPGDRSATGDETTGTVAAIGTMGAIGNDTTKMGAEVAAFALDSIVPPCARPGGGRSRARARGRRAARRRRRPAEAIEDVRQELRGDALAGVAHREPNRLSRARLTAIGRRPA